MEEDLVLEKNTIYTKFICRKKKILKLTKPLF